MRTRRAGTTLGDELKCAILLRCLSGALKTHLSLSLKETSTYNELREDFLRWDRARQKGPIWCLHQTIHQTRSPWRWTGFKARASTITKANESPTRATRKGSQSRKARIKANQRATMTKAVNLEKESQSKIQGKERDKVIELAMFAEKQATWPKIVGAL